MTFIHFLTEKSSGILSDISSDILFGISSGIWSGISSGILSGKSSGILSGISSGILSGISSGIYSDISSGILSGILLGILSGISSDILSDILSKFLLHILCPISSYMRSGREHLAWILAVEVRQGTLGVDGRGWGPAGNTASIHAQCSLPDLTTTIHAQCSLPDLNWARMVVVEVRQGTLGVDGRGWGPAGNTGRGWSWLRSGREHHDHPRPMFPAGPQLGVDGRGWGPAENTVDRGSQLSKDDEDDEEDEEEEERRTRQEEAEEEEKEEEEKEEEEATDIKSNNPHLAGGEQQTCHNGVFTTDSLCPKAFAELKTWIWQEIDLHWIDFWMNFSWSFHYIQFFLCIMSANNQLLRFGQSSGLLSHPCESKYFERQVLASVCLRFFFNLAAFCCQKNAIHV